MKKKLITLLTAGVLAVSLAGCSGELSNEYVTVKQYKGLEVAQVLPEDITDDDIDSEIQIRLQMSVKEETITDRPAQDGDMVDIDFTGTIDGEEFSGGSAEGYAFQLGSGAMIGATDDYKGFEEQIVGHNTGDEFDIQVQFPEDYSLNPDMSGVVADFHIVLNKIYTSEVPELTDEWVKENSEESETVDEYKEEIRQFCIDQLLATEMQDVFMDQIEAKKYPEGEVEAQISDGEEYYNQYAVSVGLDLDTFIENYIGMTREDFDAQMKESAQNVVKTQEAVKLLADKLAEYLPIDLFTIADRVGSILFQFPSLNVRYRYQVRNEETAFHHSLTLDPRIPDVSHILVTSELIQDENIVGRSDFLCDRWQVEKELAVGDASRLCRTTIVDLQTHLVLSSQSTSLMREMTGFCHLSDPFSEPRTIWDSEKKQCTKVQITSQETIHVDPNHVLLRDKLIENRQYAEKVKTLEKRLEFCQYKPGQRPRALADLRTLMNRGHDGMVYLWDPYLSVDDLLETWYYTTVFGMKLHAITSKSASGKEEVPAWIQEQRQRIQSRSNNRGISLELRCQWGTHGYGFHDRFLMIVREHKTPEVWSLGTSVNSIGTSHHILQKVSHPQMVVDAFEKLWDLLSAEECLVWKTGMP